jgi:hypothetical protein
MLKGMGGYLTAFDFGAANPAQQAFTDYALSEIGVTDPAMIWHGTKVKNIFNGDIWVLNNTPDTAPPIFEWVNDGPEIISADLSVVNASSVEGLGRNLLEVLGVTTIAEAMAELQRKCNNNGEIANGGIPDFGNLMVGDYLDGLDLSGIAAPTGGTAPGAWNDIYKNNRIVISGFNTYKNAGSTENAKNHILFTFRNIIAKARMNVSDDNAGGYRSSELRVWLEGASGDGSGVFATGLKAALGGGNILYRINKYHSRKGSSGADNYTVFIPTEIEMFGNQTYGDELNYYNTNAHFPIYQDGFVFRCKRWNGTRDWHWLHTPSASSSSSFCSVNNNGHSIINYASGVGGVAPAFCVA